MQQGQFKIIDDYLCIRMPKEIDHHNAEILSKKVDNYIYGEKVNHVVFDFIDTEFMDSSGIGIPTTEGKVLTTGPPGKSQ